MCILGRWNYNEKYSKREYAWWVEPVLMKRLQKLWKQLMTDASDNLSFCLSWIWLFWYRWSSVPLYHVCTACWEISMCPLTPWCKTFHELSDLYPCSIGIKIAYMESHLRSG